LVFERKKIDFLCAEMYVILAGV